MDWTAHHVRALRDACRLNREEFAEFIGAAPKSVQNWETGAITTISHFMQRALDSALDRVTPEQRQRYLTRVAASDGTHQGSQPDFPDHLQASETIVVPTGGPGTSAYLESVELDRRVEETDVGPETLHRLDCAVQDLGRAYLHSPPARIIDEARAVRHCVIKLLNGRHTLDQRARLYAVAAGLTALIGHASFDLGHGNRVVDGHCETAVHLAREINHGELISWVRGTQAMAATYRGRLGAAVALARAGQDAAPTGSITTARLHAQEARAQARLGSRASAERALGAAEQDLDRQEDAPSTSIFSFAYPYLPFYAGTCYSWLGLADLAALRSREAIALCDGADADWPVARVLARVDLAGALMQKGELDGAAELASECLDICVSGRRTDVMKDRLHGLLREVGARRGASTVRALDDQYCAVFGHLESGSSPSGP